MVCISNTPHGSIESKCVDRFDDVGQESIMNCCSHFCCHEHFGDFEVAVCCVFFIRWQIQFRKELVKSRVIICDVIDQVFVFFCSSCFLQHVPFDDTSPGAMISSHQSRETNERINERETAENRKVVRQNFSLWPLPFSPIEIRS